MRSRSLVRGFAAVALVLSPFAAVGSPKPEPVALRDGLVVDTAQAIAYVMHPQGGVAAIDLRNGAMLWRSAAAERPLTLDGDLLVAQARPGERGELRVVALDSRRAGTRIAEADLPMPAGVRAEASETLSHLFSVTARPSTEGIVVLWESQDRPALQRRTGLSVHDDAALARLGAKRTAWGDLLGFAIFDPRAGRLLPLDAERGELVAGLRKSGSTSLSRPDASERLFASIDGRHVLASRKVGRLTAAGEPYSWTISEAAGGRTLGTIGGRTSMSPFLVVETLVVQVVLPRLQRHGEQVRELPLRLRAVNLISGQESWSVAIHDSAFQGPTPN